MGEPSFDAADLDERIDQFLAASTDHDDPTATWQQQYDHGLAWVHFPNGRGGLGLPSHFHLHVRNRLRDAGIPFPFPTNPIGHGMAAPTLVAHAASEVCDRLLRPLFSNEEIWCQLFSEPEAGSDLAGLATTATKDGDDWRIRGQKVWTSLAHQAAWALCLARTDPDVPKHRGLTYFVVEMGAPGVTVRPLRQMTGDAEFNEVYLDDVAVPDHHRLGAVGAGWQVAMTTLANERSTLGDGEALGGGVRAIDEATRLLPSAAFDDPSIQSRFVALWARAAALDALTAMQARDNGAEGADGSIPKVVAGELNIETWDLVMDVLGQDAVRFGDGYGGIVLGDSGRPDPRWSYLRSRANTIEGGTTEVQLNIIGERLLALPPDLRNDRNVPWRQIPRGVARDRRSR